jgi:hypothetical protein
MSSNFIERIEARILDQIGGTYQEARPFVEGGARLAMGKPGVVEIGRSAHLSLPALDSRTTPRTPQS